MVTFLVRKRAGKGGPRTAKPAPGRPRRGIPGRALRLATAGTAVAVALLAAACSSSGGTGKSSATADAQFGLSGGWGTTWSLNQYNPLALGIADGLSLLPLAVENDPSLTSFTPQLASSWTASGNTLTIQMRPGVKWQNGQPVTSTDVYDTIVLDGTNGSAGWLYMSGVSAPSSHEVVVTARPGANMTLLEDNLLTIYIYPASTYGQFVTPALEQEDAAYYAKDATNPAAAAKMPQYAAMEAAFKKLSAYNVPTLIGDGPFQLKAINTAQAVLTKSPSFYDAASIRIADVVCYNEPNEGVYPLLFSGTLDFSGVYMSPSILNKWASTSGSNTAITPAFTYNLVFNSHAYPLTMTSVRQALAYVIPRANMISSAYGGSSVADRGGLLNQYPDGLPSYMNSLYLTPSEISQLSTYPVNTAKATSLLTSAGFHKTGGKWIMPNGKPFTLTFEVNSATTDIVASFDAAASALSAFGISSSLDSTQGTIQGEDLSNGNFQINMAFTGGPDPLYNNIDQMLGTATNYETLGNYAGDRGIGFGPTMNVPGLGKVNVPATLDQESQHVGPGAQMNQLVWDWARLVNQQMPYLTYGTKIYQWEYSTRHFTDWPPVSSTGTSLLWNIMGQGNSNQALTLMLEQGYIRPKS